MEQNSCLQVRLRKDRNTLVVVGAGVIAFGVWSVIKAVMYAAVNIETLLVTRSGERRRPSGSPWLSSWRSSWLCGCTSAAPPSRKAGA